MSATTHNLDFFFLRGFGRSGTNWVCRLLNLHPAVHCLGEYPFFQIRNAIRHMGEDDWGDPGRADAMEAAMAGFRDLIERSLAATARQKPTARWIGDRTPGPLDPLLPGKPHVVIIRDGRDVLVSWTFHLIRNGRFAEYAELRPMAGEIARSLRDRGYYREHPERLLASEDWVRSQARMWARRIERDLDAAEMMAAGSPATGRALVIRYEDLHADPEGERASMYRLLGLDADEALPLSAESRTTPGPEAENPHARLRKGAVGDWRTYFTEDTSAWFLHEAAGALDRAGYHTMTPSGTAA